LGQFLEIPAIHVKKQTTKSTRNNVMLCIGADGNFTVDVTDVMMMVGASIFQA